MVFSWEAKLTRGPLDANRPDDFRRDEGAVVDFYGVVRETEGNRAITGIEYEALEPIAKRMLADIAATAGDRYGVSRVILHH
ncbi:MAG: molybdenum cofactor biosynthesis protein MoaE, partial [Verrucomicrobia bacterium]|nr:molybdenum cofactor biosynthesis protein MoaE [Verrucomicrobiota bacterium]